MPRKKTKPTFPAPEPEIIREPEPTPSAPAKTEAIPRLNLPLIDDGTQIDWERVRPSNKQKFADLMRTDPVAREVAFGPMDTDDNEADLFGGVTEANVAAALDILAQTEALAFTVLAGRFIKHPLKKDAANKALPFVIDRDVALAAFKLTPEQHAEIDPRAYALSKKYDRQIPDWLKKNMDLYMLVGMFLKYSGENAVRAMQMQVQRDVTNAVKAVRRPIPVRPADSDAQKMNGKDVSGDPFEGNGPDKTEQP